MQKKQHTHTHLEKDTHGQTFQRIDLKKKNISRYIHPLFPHFHYAKKYKNTTELRLKASSGQKNVSVNA